MLIVAIVLSLLTTWLTLQYLKSKEQSIEAEMTARNQKNQGETVAVVVPVQRLLPGTPLSENMVAARNVPADFIYEDTMTVTDFEGFKGQALLHQVEKGRPLRKSDVREVFADFSGTLKSGKRAMTIAVDEINSVSHMIEPGNTVDLMLVIGGGEGTTSQTVVPFLDQVKVLATGQKVTREDPGTQDPTEKRRANYGTITLEVTPTQAARLTLAGELGKIRAVLRNETDRQAIDFESVNSINLLDEIREREKRVAPPKSRSPRISAGPATVEYIIGGKGNGDALAAAMNVPLPSSPLPGASGAAPAGQISAGTVTPEVLSQLLKLGAPSKPASSK